MAEAADNDESRMPLLDHLVELRRRLTYCVIAFVVLFFFCFHFSNEIFDFLARPLYDLIADRPDAKLQLTDLLEGFFTHIKVAFFGAICISFPVFSMQVWKFVAPGLYSNEKRAFFPFLLATPILFLMGAAMVYYFVMPLAYEFLLTFESPGGEGALKTELQPKMNEYLSLAMKLIFAFGLGFELPVLLVLLAHAGIVSAKGLAEKRRYAIVGVFVFAAVLTPPDIISQILLAVPIIILYEISILCARAIEKRRERELEDD